MARAKNLAYASSADIDKAVVRSVGGLGCPYCKWSGSNIDARTKHIVTKHKGKSSAFGAEDEMTMMMMRPGNETRSQILRARSGEVLGPRNKISKSRKRPTH